MKLNLTLTALLYTLILLATGMVGAINSVQPPQYNRQFENRFKDKYAGRKYNYEGREVIRPTTSKFGDPSKYSENNPDCEEDNTTGNFSFNYNIVNGVFLFILIFAFVFLAHTFIKTGGSRLFFSKAQQKIDSYDNITAANIQEADIRSLIDAAENNKDFRLAIRYYYLLVLKQLARNHYIIYKDDKTNADYLEAIASEKFRDVFAYTSYIYNYTWYGEFLLDPKEYQWAKERFICLIKDIDS